MIVVILYDLDDNCIFNVCDLFGMWMR